MNVPRRELCPHCSIDGWVRHGTEPRTDLGGVRPQPQQYLVQMWSPFGRPVRRLLPMVLGRHKLRLQRLLRDLPAEEAGILVLVASGGGEPGLTAPCGVATAGSVLLGAVELDVHSLPRPGSSNRYELPRAALRPAEAAHTHAPDLQSLPLCDQPCARLTSCHPHPGHGGTGFPARFSFLCTSPHQIPRSLQQYRVHPRGLTILRLMLQSPCV